MSAFLHLALDTGARKSELVGLTWSNVDLDTATVTISQQLDAPTSPPAFGPTKTHATRTLTLGAETVARLRTHRSAQAALKLRNRRTYADWDLVFAKEPEHGGTLGDPVKSELATTAFRRVIASAEVRPITFHGTRHTVATLLLQAWRAGACRERTARPRPRRNDVGGVRARAAVAPAGCDGPACCGSSRRCGLQLTNG